MSFKRSPEQVCETLRGGITDFMGAEVMSVFYETTPEAIKEVNDRVKGEIQRMIDSYHENRIEETLWK